MARTADNPNNPKTTRSMTKMGTKEREALNTQFAQSLINNDFKLKTASDENGLTRQQGQTLQNSKRVKAQIIRLLVEGGTTPQVVQSFLVTLMKNDPADFNDLIFGGANLKEIRARGVDTRTIKKVTRDSKGGVKSVEWHDSKDAAMQLAKIYGMLNEHRSNTNIGELNLIVNGDTAGDIYDIAEKQKVIVESKEINGNSSGQSPEVD